MEDKEKENDSAVEIARINAITTLAIAFLEYELQRKKRWWEVWK